MEWTDTHVHLLSYWQQGRLSDVLKRAGHMGVAKMIAVGTGKDNDYSIYQKIASDYPHTVDYTIGLHPSYVTAEWAAHLPDFETFFQSELLKQPVGIGEIGLDSFHLPQDPVQREMILDYQKEAFRAQLAVAKRWNAPVIVHSRGEFDNCLLLLDKSGVDLTRVVFHCFVEGPMQMQALLERGIWASFTGIISYKNADIVREALKTVPLERLMLETDAPYLAPVPYRGKENEPAYVVHVAEACAQVLGIPLMELSAYTQNAVKQFWYGGNKC